MGIAKLFKGPEWRGVAAATLKSLGAVATEVRLDERQYVTRQYHPAEYFYLLVSGGVTYHIRLEDSAEDLKVGAIERPCTPIGWSGFQPPARYATSVRCSRDSVLLRWSYQDLLSLFEADPVFGRRLLRLTLDTGMELLRQGRAQLDESAREHWDFKPVQGDEEAPAGAAAPPVPDLLDLLRGSPFFEVFPEDWLRALPPLARARDYRSGERLFDEGDPAEDLCMLGGGAVALGFDAGRGPRYFRTLSNPGQVVDWATLLPGHGHQFTVVAARDTRVYLFQRPGLEALIERQPVLGLALSKRLLWLLSNHLRSLRVRLISLRGNRERPAIRNLLEQSGPRLAIDSPLHKVPHLLEDRLTLADAFACLRAMRDAGTALERSLAGLCLDILQETRRELDFFQGLKKIYRLVTEAPPEQAAEETRRQCAAACVELFSRTRHRLVGEEHLPERPGHIFILNHLANHPWNTLPNRFQITLDSHFVSSMLLYRRYGDPGVRVVRKSRGEEYGHQYYYDRLGHIYVHTGESDLPEAEPAVIQRDRFYRDAAEQLRAGRNLVICPEGTSRPSEESPGPLRPGAFQLALSLDPEPLIVPVAVANFDLRVNQAAFTAVVKPPLRVSERVRGSDPRLLRVFLDELRTSYREWVREAAVLGEAAAGER